MSKKKSVLDRVEEMPTTPTAAKNTKMVPVIRTTAKPMVAEETGEKKKPGRPAVEGSARQIKLAEMEEKRSKGELKRGRPAVAGSARQIREAEKATKRANGELTGKQGRPVNGDSDRQKRLATRKAMIDAGLHTGKPGRPAVKAEIIEYREVDADAPDVIVETVGEDFVETAVEVTE